jgi:hypothetical protein
MRLVVLEVVQPSQRDHGPRTPALHRPTSRAYLQIHAAEGVPSDRLDHEHAEILAACQARDPERVGIDRVPAGDDTMTPMFVPSQTSGPAS